MTVRPLPSRIDRGWRLGFGVGVGGVGVPEEKQWQSQDGVRGRQISVDGDEDAT
jgi:hypothetical protein